VITEWLVDTALGLATGFVDLLPDVPLDLSGVGSAFGLAMTFDAVAPVTEGLAVASLLLSITGLMFAWRVLRTLMSHVPWIGGNG